jgi:hypothetical protein
MSLPKFARRNTITIQDPGTRTVYGSEVVDWDNPGPPRTARGIAVPARTEETEDNRTSIRTGWDVYLEPGTVVHSSSKLTLPDGNDYGVVGDPAELRSPSGRLDHIYLYAERWTG